jgi:hypothetical protein
VSSPSWPARYCFSQRVNGTCSTALNLSPEADACCSDGDAWGATPDRSIVGDIDVLGLTIPGP